MKRYNPKVIEPKWQKIWDETGLYTANLTSDKPKYIAMSMFNYPSGAGLHIGHALNYTISEVKSRFKRQQGFESYHPVGWDSFGLPAENYAIKTGVSPQESMANIIPGYHKQYKAMGWSNDWEKEISTHLPEYYKWTQWIFSEMYRNGLAYQDSRMQWWCEVDNTVLANEQVIDGKCWRHDGPDDPLVEKKEIKQWFFKITDFADELLEYTDALDWTDSVKLAQKNWIGKSEGAEVDFKVDKNIEGQEFVLIHGYQGSKNVNFWQWLKTNLEDKGAKVFLYDLPEPDKPNVETQVKFILDKYKFNSKSNIVAHSLGASVTIKLLEGLKEKINNVYLVAPFLSDERIGLPEPNLSAASDFKFNFKQAKPKANKFYVLEDENDFAIPPGLPETFARKLDASYVLATSEKSHYCAKEEPEVLNLILPDIKVFTTRVDTIYSGAFVAVAPENQILGLITTENKQKEVEAYISKSKLKSELERQENKEKTGVFTGAYVINPANKEKLPVWVADFVLGGYGTGAVFGDIHDERDFEFINKYSLEAKVSVVPENEEEAKKVLNKEYPFTDQGILINSDQFDGMKSQEAKEKITEFLERKGLASKKINYRMRDWSVSRQRYWGAPIPIIHCKTCGPVLVPDYDLPVILPELQDFAPSGDGRSALAKASDWLNVKCPDCGNDAERETDTLDTYICSSWYMFRYLDPFNQEKAFDSEIVNKWAPIDFYNGGDHATAHLLYARFIGHFFKSIGLIDNPEPFKQMLYNGKIMASDGSAFSKSKGNGIDPLEIIDSGYGADALRTYLMFATPLELSSKWDPQGVPGAFRFLNRVWNLVQEYLESDAIKLSDTEVSDINRSVHTMIKKMTIDIEENRYNTAIAAAMACTNDLYKFKAEKFGKHDTWKSALESLIACIAPFAPHIAEELWSDLGHSISIHKDSWPNYDDKLIESDEAIIVVQINGKLRANISLPKDSDQELVEARARGLDKVKEQLDNKEILKVIYISNKLINFVVKS